MSDYSDEDKSTVETWNWFSLGKGAWFERGIDLYSRFLVLRTIGVWFDWCFFADFDVKE